MFSTILCGFYAAGFVMLASLPQGRWFRGGLAVAVLIFCKAWYDIDHRPGPGQIFAGLAFQWLVAGVIAALLSRVAVRFVSPATSGWTRVGFLLPAGFITGAVVTFALLS